MPRTERPGASTRSPSSDEEEEFARLRGEFPILERTVNGHPLVYLDSGATAQKPRAVIEAEADFYFQRNANVHRGIYQLAEQATEAYEAARERVARFLHARDPQEIVFTRGTTEAINLVAYSLAHSRLKKGDRVLTTVMDHHSNIVPWHLIRTYFGTTLDFLDVDDSGRLRLADLEPYWDGRTKVVAIPHVSNVLGTVVPVKEIARRAHDHGSLVVVDAAQSAPHRPIDVQELGADVLAFSGHKVLGPTGIGVLWARRELLEEMPPWMGGGQMIESVARDRITYREPPAKFEAGTPNIAGAVALGVALDFLESVGWEKLARHERRLTARFFEQAAERFSDRMTIYGPPELEDREAVIAFSLRGAHPHDIASLLDAEGVAVRAGQHCSQILMERFGVPAMTRASPYLYNSLGEIDRFFEVLERVAKVLT